MIHLATTWLQPSRVRLGAVVALAAALSWSCGGSVSGDKGESVHGGGASGDAGPLSAGAGGSSGGRTPGAGGLVAVGGSSGGGTPGAGGRTAAGGAATTDASTASECPIRVSGTILTEADCYPCIPPGTPCESALGLPAIDAEGCVNLIRMQTTLWCEWYADGDPFTRPWGAVVICQSNPGRVFCGGGL